MELFKSLLEPSPVDGSATQKRMLCIVLSFNGRNDTVACLDGLLEKKIWGMDVLVVDNASEYGVVEHIAESHPEVEFLRLEENLGWAGGNNAGIRIGLERGYDWICLLNNDLVFPAGQAESWFNAVNGLPPALVHPTIYYWSEPTVAQLHPDADETVEHRSVGNWHGKAVMNFAYGACLAVHHEVFQRVGLLDERFFLQLEETDFHHRANKGGYLSVCDLNVKIFHKESRAFGGNRAPIKTYYSVRNSLLLIEKKKESLKLVFKDVISLYWSLSRLAGSDRDVNFLGKAEFMMWIFSNSLSALAVRTGVQDYLFRNFGKIAQRKFLKLQQPAIFSSAENNTINS